MMRFGASISVSSVFALLIAGQAQADVIADANKVLLDAIKAQKSTPPLAARSLAIFHMAAASAVAETRHGEVSADEQRVRALGALLEVGEAEFPEFVGPIQEWVAQATPQTVSAEGRLRALSLGRASARAVLTTRNGDLAIARLPDFVSAGANTSGFPVWAPPAGKVALHPRWGEVTPIALSRDDVPLLPSPNPTDSYDFRSDLLDAFLHGGSKSDARSESERIGAIFWAQNAGSVTPPGQWNNIAQGFSKKAQLSLTTEAKLFSALNVAMFDASIACWKNKYHFRRARPDAAVAAMMNATWNPLLPTPPHPEYPSGHSTFSAAAATVLEAFNRVQVEEIEVTSEDAPGEIRRYTSFAEAAADAGRSRIFGGIHFEESNAAGQILGQDVARKVLRAHFVEE